MDLARAQPGVFGARLTGGGFGGAVVLLARAGAGAKVARRVAAAYAGWKSDPRHAYVDPEPELNALGYGLLGEKRFAEAIRVFRLAVEAAPNSANAYDSLGEAYAAAGDREAAVRSYEKALALDPRFDSARDALKKLRPAS